MPAKIVSLDFGSANTKLAVRHGWNLKSRVLRSIPLLSDQIDTFCVPSVVARINRGSRVNWIIGNEAANQPANERATIFRNWKAELFSDNLMPERERDLLEVGTIYFRGLRRAVESSSKGNASAAKVARVSIPKLENDGAVRRRMSVIIENSGWALAPDGLVYEPESNAIGVFSRGKNATHHPYGGACAHELYPYFLDVFQPEGILAAIRAGHDCGIFVMDVGAFTTDFGYVKFSDDAEARPEVMQRSVRKGIADLDDRVFRMCGEGVAEALQTASVNTRDQVKRLLYAGEKAMVSVDGEATTIGAAAAEKAAITREVNRFAASIIELAMRFIDEQKGPLSYWVLTGGGGNIAALRRSFLRAAERTNGGRVYDLLDPEEPSRVLLRERDAQGRFYLNPRAVEERLGENREDLMRCGSAMGGCSVYFDGHPLG